MTILPDIERYECPAEGCPSHTPIFGKGHMHDCPAGARVRVEYVRADRLEGAVEALRLIFKRNDSGIDRAIARDALEAMGVDPSPTGGR